MLSTFAHSPEGDLFAASGFATVKRWPGFGSAFVDAGVPPAANKVTLASSGTGGILGTFYAYHRFLDADGNPGSLSPVSLAHTPSNLTGPVMSASNASPIVITDTAHGLTTNNIVTIGGVAGNYGANGTWKVTVLSADTFSLAHLDGTASIGNGEYLAGGTWVRGAGTLTYGNLPVAYPDARAVRIQLLRTKDGDSTVAYIDYDSATLPGATHASTKADDDLGDPVVLLDLTNRDAATSFYAEPPADKPYLANCNGRMVYTGDPVYSVGSVAVTNASDQVTGHGTAWTSAMVGRFLHIPGAPAAYSIEAVNTATQVLTLDAVYGGTTNPFVRYSIRSDVGNRRSVLWSAPTISDAVSPLDALSLPDDALAGEITGAVTLNRWVYVFAEARMYRFSFGANPATDGVLSNVLSRGCVNNRSWAVIDGEIYALDRQGVYATNGADLVPLSTPLWPLFDPDSGSAFRIQWEWSEHFHCVPHPAGESILFFVSLTGGPPRHALVYRYRRKSWDILEYAVPITSSCLGALRGRPQVYLGSMSREILAANVGHSDGVADSDELRGEVTSAGVDWVTDSGATFGSLVNVPVRIVSGRGKGQMRLVVENTATTLYVDQPWSVRPDTTSVYQVGGIEWRYRTGWKRWAVRDGDNRRGLELVFRPCEREASIEMSVYENHADDPNTMGRSTEISGVTITNGESAMVVDATKANGRVAVPLPMPAEAAADGARFASVALEGVTNAEAQAVHLLVIEGAGE